MGCVKQMTCTDPGALRPRSPEEENHRAPWPSRKGLWGVTRWETGQARSKQLFTGLDLLAVQGTLKSLLQHHSSKASVLLHSVFFIVQLSHPYMHDYWKNHSLD